LSVKLKGGDSLTTAGHSSRVLAARFAPAPCGDGNLLVSGGWDNTVQFWDLRAGHAVRLIYGPHICGDALDMEPRGKLLLTGSWREDEPLELWDFGTGKRVEALPWRSEGSSPSPCCLLYAARFSRDPAASMIVAGGSFPGPGLGEAKVIERRPAEASDAGSGAGSGCRCAGTLVRFTCISADFSPRQDNPMVAFAGSDGRVRAKRLEPDSSAAAPAPLSSALGGGGPQPSPRTALAHGAGGYPAPM